MDIFQSASSGVIYDSVSKWKWLGRLLLLLCFWYLPSLRWTQVSREVYLLVTLILYMRLKHNRTCVRFQSVHQDRKELLIYHTGVKIKDVSQAA